MSGFAGSATLMMGTPGAVLQTTSQQIQQQEWIPTLIHKRITTFRYLQRCFQGGMVLYNTALVSEQEMRAIWTDEKMQRRSQQYFFLGTSLATILEIPITGDCLKALTNVLQEYDHFAAAESRSKSIFSKSGRKATSDGRTFEETGEYSYLEVRTLPFNLDYIITTSTLCDMIGLLYEKLWEQQQQDKLWNFQVLESFQKIDAKFKKILTTMYKELEAVSRDVMIQEFAALDPLASTSMALHDDDWNSMKSY
ncbi:hypothetical protein EMPS_07924 [Entomortierella parvispora]|uniref:Uncharacterized protein n=1 Tax=Entomortierella parvispora TaxID=205924 RepID=A0A9P3LYL3_9FUNG|nr:hypothetical protein EMPS_07924 [Entomortierella parvispora]